MSEEEENEFFNSQFQSSLKRFEEELENSKPGFYDSDLLEQFIDHYLIKNQIKKAMNVCEHALYQFPYSNLFKLRMAQMYSAIGQLEDSLEILEELSYYEYSSSELFATKATVYSQLKKHDKAIHFFKQAIAHSEDEEKDELYLDLAMEYETLNDFDNAIQVLKQILTINPNNEAALYEIAYCYDLTKQFDKAIEFYNKYIESHPYSFTAWYNLGNTYCKTENFEKAVWAYDYCIIINDKFSSAYFNMGNALGNLGRHQEAIESYLKCIDIDGNDAITFNYIGECYEKLENFDKALDYYNKSIELNNDIADPWLGIGIIKDLQGKTSESINFFKKATELQEENYDYWHVLAEAYEKMELFPEAVEAYEKVIELSNFVNTDAIIGLAKLKLDDSPIEALELVIDIKQENELNNKLDTFLVFLFWKNNRFLESLSLLESLLVNNKDSIKNLFLHFPEAKELTEFIDIIENYT